MSNVAAETSEQAFSELSHACDYADDGFTLPMNVTQVKARIARAKAFLEKHPIPLFLEKDVPELIGVN